MPRLSARGASLVLALALALPALAGCLAAAPQASEPPWTALGVLYAHPSSPYAPPVADDPAAGTSWWTEAWGLYEVRHDEDVARMRALVGEDANATVFLAFPLYHAGAANATEPLDRATRAAQDFAAAGFDVVLLLTHHAHPRPGEPVDPVASSLDAADVVGSLGAVLRHPGLADAISVVALDSLSMDVARDDARALEHHRALKATANAQGVPLHLHLGPEWVPHDGAAAGYTAGTVSPAAGASDGVILSSAPHPRLEGVLERLIDAGAGPERLWLLERVANCDLWEAFPEDAPACVQERPQSDLQLFFRAASAVGVTRVGAGAWSDGGGEAPPRHGMLSSDGAGFTSKAQAFHDFVVGRHDPLP